MGLFDIIRQCAVAVSTAIQNNNDNTPANTPVEAASSDYLDYHIGDLARRYETSNKGPGYISNGSQWGDPGGDSYGSYQLETKKGTMQEYLRGEDPFIDELKGLIINSPAFKAKWEELAASDPKGFQQSQFNFLANKPGGYIDAYNYAKKLGWAVHSFAMQSAIFSTSNQSGNWKLGIFDEASINPADDIVTQINKLYDSRASYFRSIALNATVKSSIIKNRTVDERKDCLKLI